MLFVESGDTGEWGTVSQRSGARWGGSAPVGAGRRDGDGGGDAWMGRVRSWNGRVRCACECTDKHGEVGDFFYLYINV